MRLLDLFCGAGGAAMGYHCAGFDVVGVDIEPQPNYPFEFHQADALEWDDFDGFDVVHASPPCQFAVSVSRRWRGKGTRADSHPNLIPATRQLLRAAGVPYVIENVEAASPHLENSVKLCGATLGLQQSRHRLFEIGGGPLILVTPCACRGQEFLGVYGSKPDGRWIRRDTLGRKRNFIVSSLAEGQSLLGIDWMTWDELREAIPPAYTEFIGRQLADQLVAA